MYPQDPPPYPPQPGQQQPFPQLSKDSWPQYPQYPQDPAPQYPAQYPPTQSYPPYGAEAQPHYPTYPPYPAAQQQQYPGYPPAYPGHGYPQAAYGPPPRRTEFGWSSIIVASIALLTSWVPYFNIVSVLAAIVLVLAGWLGQHERSRIPAAFGTGITALALVSTVIFSLLWRDIFRGFFGF